MLAFASTCAVLAGIYGSAECGQRIHYPLLSTTVAAQMPSYYSYSDGLGDGDETVIGSDLLDPDAVLLISITPFGNGTNQVLRSFSGYDDNAVLMTNIMMNFGRFYIFSIGAP